MIKRFEWHISRATSEVQILFERTELRDSVSWGRKDVSWVRTDVLVVRDKTGQWWIDEDYNQHFNRIGPFITEADCKAAAEVIYLQGGVFGQSTTEVYVDGGVL